MIFDENKTYAFFWKGDYDHYFLGHQFEEIFKTRIYKPYLENIPDAVVVDLGGNLGLFSLYASKYAKQIYCVEPSTENVENIQHMLRFNELTNIKIIQKAIFTEDGNFPLFDNQNRTMRSLHQAVADPNLKPELVTTVTLETLFKDEKIDHVNLLKMDIEGSEIEVLSSLSFKAVADKIDTIVLELHAWSGRHPNQAKEALKNNGFEVSTIPNDANILVGTRKK